MTSRAFAGEKDSRKREKADDIWTRPIAKDISQGYLGGPQAGNGQQRNANLKVKTMSSKVKKNSTMIRVPHELKAELEALAAEWMEAHEAGRTEVNFVEQGSKGTWMPLHEVISKCVKEVRGHQARSRKSRKPATVEA